MYSRDGELKGSFTEEAGQIEYCHVRDDGVFVVSQRSSSDYRVTLRSFDGTVSQRFVAAEHGRYTPVFRMSRDDSSAVYMSSSLSSTGRAPRRAVVDRLTESEPQVSRMSLPWPGAIVDSRDGVALMFEWDVRSAALGHRWAIVGRASNGNRLAPLAAGKQAELGNGRTGSGVFAVLSSNAAYFVTGVNLGQVVRVRIWQTSTGRLLGEALHPSPGNVGSMSLSNDDQYLTLGFGRVLALFRIADLNRSSGG